MIKRPKSPLAGLRSALACGLAMTALFAATATSAASAASGAAGWADASTGDTPTTRRPRRTTRKHVGGSKKYLLELEPDVVTVVTAMALDADVSPTRLLEEMIEAEVRERLNAGYGPTFTKNYEKAAEALLHKE